MKITKCPTCNKTNDLTCLRCGHVWTPKTDDVRICPKCKSARWDTKK